MDDAQLARRFKPSSSSSGAYPNSSAWSALRSSATGSRPTLAARPRFAQHGAPGRLPDEVIELARAGHTTEAISRLRHITGATLLEAKHAVDALS